MSEPNKVIADLAPIDASVGSNRSILKEIHDNDRNKQHSPLNTKASGGDNAIVNKSNTVLSSSMGAYPRLTMSNTTESVVQQQATTIAAGSANFAPSSVTNEVTIEKNAQLHEDPLEYISSKANRVSNRFIGLPEFDEANIPELPNNLTADMSEDPLKLTFDDGIVPNIGLDLTTSFNSTTCKREIDLTSNPTHLQLPNNDPDTAVSSDNETYAECLSYRESELNYELAMEMSDTDHYRSALNSQNNTAYDADNLNATIENETEILINANNFGPNSKPVGDALKIQFFEYEPMDVDMNSTLDMSNSSQNTTLEVNHVFGKQRISHEEPTPEKTTEYVTQTQEIIENECVTASPTMLTEKSNENLPSDSKSENESTAVKSTISNTTLGNDELSNNDTEELAQVEDDNTKIGNEKEQDTDTQKESQPIPAISVPHTDSKFSLLVDTVVSANVSPKTTEPLSHGFPTKPTVENSKFPASPTALLTRPPLFLEKSEYTEHSHAEKLLQSIPVKVICSCPEDEKDKASGDNNNIERASKNVVNATNEKENMNNTISLATTVSEQNINNETSPGVNTTISMNSQISPLGNNNTTFDGSTTPSPNHITSDVPSSLSGAEKRRTFNLLDSTNLTSDATFAQTSTEKRQTFDISASPSQFTLDSLPAQTSADKRRTFNINTLHYENNNEDKGDSNISTSKDIKDRRRTYNCNPEQSTEKANLELNESHNKRSTFTVVTADRVRDEVNNLNASCEAMDVDESFSQLPNSSPHTSQRQFSPITLPCSNRTSPLSMMISRPTICSMTTAAAAHILSQSPPFSSQDALKMSPPNSPQENKKPIHDSYLNIKGEILSAKEQTKSNFKDEKDVFVEKFTPSPVEEIFASTSINPFSSSKKAGQQFGAEHVKTKITDENFSSNGNLILQQSDFDFLLTKGSNNTPVDRSSLLLRFDPLLGVPVPVNTSQQQQQALQQILQKAAGTVIGTRLPTASIAEEDQQQKQVHGDSNCANPKGSGNILTQKQQQNQQQQQFKTDPQVTATKKHANMSVDVIKDINIDNDCTKSKELSNIQLDEKQANFKMDELEKKIKNEVLKTEDIEKKLKEAEQREEAGIKRITEKDKTISKLNGVIKEYETAIAEVIADKEHLVHNYEMQLAEVKADRDSNYHHLMSLEATFSDLHVKYEKSKDMTLQLKASEEALLAEKRQNLENLRMQEQRYEKMKNHAMQQLEIANKTLETMKKEHAVETTKLKALLKKEEISRASTNEQLQQKIRENEELVKICDELINGQGS